MDDPEPQTPAHDPYAALREPNYVCFASGFFCSSFGLQMMQMALGWEIYERTNSALALGCIGLARALPVLIMALPAGQIIDRCNRKAVLILTQTGFSVAAAGIAAASLAVAPVWVMMLLIVLSGLVRTFNGPVRSSLLPDLVPARLFSNAVTWNSGVFQLSAMGGPLVAGLIIDRTGHAWPVYAVTSALCAVFAITTAFTRPHAHHAPPTKEPLLAGMAAGMRHLWHEKIILSTIALDLFAVLLGGATALFPIYAKDILQIGPDGLGLLRSAQFAGAFLMALVLAYFPIRRQAGPLLLWSVAAFGAGTIVFGISKNVWLSIAALVVMGGVDNISVVIRHVLVQTRTPRHLRGRVSAVNSVFIESSNELGGFESGAVATLFGKVLGMGVIGGAVASVVTGGVGTLLVVTGVALTWPQIRRLDRLDEPDAAKPPPGPADIVPQDASETLTSSVVGK